MPRGEGGKKTGKLNKKERKSHWERCTEGKVVNIFSYPDPLGTCICPVTLVIIFDSLITSYFQHPLRSTKGKKVTNFFVSSTLLFSCFLSSLSCLFSSLSFFFLMESKKKQRKRGKERRRRRRMLKKVMGSP